MIDKQKQIEEIILVVKEQIANNAFISIEESMVYFDDNDLDHIAEQVAETLIEKDYRKIEQEKMIELPCKVGDTVWCISDLQIIALVVKKLIIGDEFELQCFDGANVFKFTLRHFGDWLFFDREEAERRLKELQNG